MEKSSATYIMHTVAYAVAMIVISLLTILYAHGCFELSFIDRSADANSAIPLTPSDETQSTDTSSGYKYTPDAPFAPEVTKTRTPLSYTEGLELISDTSDAAGAKPTPRLYSSDGFRVVRAAAELPEAKEFSLSSMTVRALETTTDKKGSSVTTETTSSAQRPLLTVYFGYIIRDNGSTLSLCDANGKVLADDISDYQPVGKCDLAGHPLFKKDAIYYYYYDGQTILPGTIVLDRITPETAAEYASAPLPTGYSLIVEEGEITPTLPESAGMVECTVDESYFDDIAVNSSCYIDRKSDRFRICEYRREKEVTNQAEIDRVNTLIAEREAKIAAKEPGIDYTYIEVPDPIYNILGESTHWWYLDANGNVAIPYCYTRAYDFTSDGLAFAMREEDADTGTLIALNTSGSTVFRAYNKTYLFTERGSAKVRDGHFLPDTYGEENTGMLRYDGALSIVRRKLFDSSNGRVYIFDGKVAVNKRGEIFNIPYGYEIEAYRDGVFLLSHDGGYRYMKSNGTWLDGIEYQHALPFCEGLAVAMCGGKYGMIDREGNAVVPFCFDYLSSSSDGVIVGWDKDNGWCILHKTTSTPEPQATIHPVLQLKRRLIATRVAEEAAKLAHAEEEKARLEALRQEAIINPPQPEPIQPIIPPVLPEPTQPETPPIQPDPPTEETTAPSETTPPDDTSDAQT